MSRDEKEIEDVTKKPESCQDLEIVNLVVQHQRARLGSGALFLGVDRLRLDAPVAVEHSRKGMIYRLK
jgi:hypothetical protein